MKAITYSKYGSPDVLHLEEVEKPAPTDDEVLIKIHATSVNDWDWCLLAGDFINRIINGIRKPKKIQIIGSDVAGTIEAIGKNITRFKPGDDVYGDLSASGFGGFAEYVSVPEKVLALKSRSVM